MKRVGVGLAAVLLAAACTGDRPSRPSPHPPPATATASALSTPSPAVREQLDLNVFLDEPATRWTSLAFLPFGTAEHQLGLVTDPQRTPVPYVPRSFAVDTDRSIWVLDVVKKRVAHFDRAGRFLGAIEGLRFDRFSPHPRDVAISDGRIHVLEEGGDLTANVVLASPGGALDRRLVQHQGNAVTASYLFPLDQGIGAAVGGYADPSQGLGPSGSARLNLEGRGTVQVLPGIPVGSDAWIQTGFGSTDDLMTVVHTVGNAATEQPIKLVARPRQGGRPIPSTWGGMIVAAADQAIGIYVRMSPTDPGDAQRYGGGRWFMRVGRGALVLERLPDDEISDEELVRPIAAGPDGKFYLMLIRKKGVEILCRP